MINDRLSDFVTRIRNAYSARKDTVIVPHTRFLEQVASVLVQEKYLTDSKVDRPKQGFPSLVLTLNYSGTKPAVNTIRRVSKPGVRIYSKSESLRPVLSGMGLAILSTSHGIMTDRQAKKDKLGGEVLFELW